MQIGSLGDYLLEMWKPIFLEKYENISLLSAKFAQRVFKAKIPSKIEVDSCWNSVYYFYFSEKIKLEISCESIYMKC